MKKFLAVAILIFAFCAVVFAQNKQNASCPTVEIKFKYPSRAKEPFIFTAILSKEIGNITPKYIWSIAKGEIIEGQGTSSIQVLSDKGEAQVMIKIEGLAEGCSPSAMDSVVIDYSPPILIEKFSMLPTEINKAKLNNLILELENHQYARIYIVEYFQENIPQQTINQKIQKISDYLLEIKKLDKDRFKVVSSSLNENITIFWIIPDGADFPKP